MPRPIPQPARGVLALLPDGTNRWVASEYRCSEDYVSRVLRGQIEASPAFKAFLSELLGKPVSELFRDEL